MEVDRKPDYRPQSVRRHVSLFRSVLQALKRLAGIAFACAICRRFQVLLSLDALRRENFSTRTHAWCGEEPASSNPAVATAATAQRLFRPGWIGELIPRPTSDGSCHSAPPGCGRPRCGGLRGLRAGPPGAFHRLHFDSVPSANWISQALQNRATAELASQSEPIRGLRRPGLLGLLECCVSRSGFNVGLIRGAWLALSAIPPAWLISSALMAPRCDACSAVWLPGVAGSLS